MSSESNTRSLNTLLAAALVAGPILYYRYQSNLKSQAEADRECLTSLSSIVRRGNQIKPPFPQVVRDMLSKCRLAYLSTVDTEEGSSHLSLMRFTYLNDKEDGEVVIMSTQRKTKKYTMLTKQRGVAMLVHDFGQHSVAVGLYSITLNGNCRIVDDPIAAEKYRSAHLANNPDYPQFIVGDDIAILCVDVTKARICDVNDCVTTWDVTGNKLLG